MRRRMPHLAIVTTAPGRKRISSNGWPPAAPLARTPAPSWPGSNPSPPPLNNRPPWFAPSERLRTGWRFSVNPFPQPTTPAPSLCGHF